MPCSPLTATPAVFATAAPSDDSLRYSFNALMLSALAQPIPPNFCDRLEFREYF
ncbi:MAG TPA: hypothetical protein V6D16_11215 [Candidatus Obscuribacterales bacterium]